MAALNYAQNYGDEIENRYNKELCSGDIWIDSAARIAAGFYKFTGANALNIPTIDVLGAVDVSRDSTSASFTRKVDNAWELKTMTQYREWDTMIDPIDADETNTVMAISKAAHIFEVEQKIPEYDKYTFSNIAVKAEAAGVTANTTVLSTGDLVLAEFDRQMKDMDEAEVPQEGRIWYITPATDALLKNGGNIRRLVDYRNSKANDNEINRVVRHLDGVKVVCVPSSRMLTVYDYTIGAIPGVSPKQINAMLIHPRSIIAVQKYEFLGAQDPTAVTKGKTVMYLSYYYDVFILDRKKDGIQLNRAV